jgi:ribosomal protein S18 acetylase RimI-like enzyme
VDVTSLGFRTDLMVLAAGGSEITQHEEHLVVRTPANPTYWWGNFVLFARPDGDIPARMELFATELPAAKHVAWGIDSVDGDAGDEAGLTAAGFTVERNTVLTATALTPPRRPVDATLRALDGDGDWDQLLELRLDTHTDSEHYTREFEEGKIAEARALCAGGRATWYGAFDGDGLRSALGLVADGTGLGRYQSVETHPDARRRGLAGALVHHAGRTALDAGAHTLVIVADPEYHAIGLYRALGFTDGEVQVQLTKPPSG